MENRKHLKFPWTNLRSLPFWSIICYGLVILLIVGTDLPLGISKDWVWRRVVNPLIPIFEILSIGLIFLIGVFLAWWTDRKIKNNVTKLIGVLCITILGIAFDYQVLLAGRIGIAENIIVQMDTWATGYLTRAARIDNLREFLSNYHLEQKQDSDASNHTDVHPPGNTILAYGAYRLASQETATEFLSLFIESSQFNSDVKIFIAESQMEIPGNQIKTAYRAAVILFIFFLICIFISNILILTAIGACSKSKTNLGLCALLVWSIPAPILFMGSFDVAYYCLSSLLCLFIMSWIRRLGHIMIPYVLGVLIGFGVFFTVGYGIFILFLAGILLFGRYHDKISFLPFLIFLSGGGSVVAVLYLMDIHIVEICWYCLRNNNRYFSEANRSNLWIIVNYLDYFLFLGSFEILVLWIQIRKSFNRLKRPLFPYGMGLIYGVTLVLLFTLSFSRGEMGRLAMLLYPVNIILGAYACQRLFRSPSAYFLGIFVIMAAILQLLVIRICTQQSLFI